MIITIIIVTKPLLLLSSILLLLLVYIYISYIYFLNVFLDIFSREHVVYFTSSSASWSGPISLALVALVFGVGNGMCGGVINAFAASLTPPHARTQFLGLWMLGSQGAKALVLRTLRVDVFACLFV